MNLPIANPFSTSAIATFLLLTTPLSGHGAEPGRETEPVIEVFTTSQYPIPENMIDGARNDTREHYTLYEIDRISLFQEALSQGLPSDPAQAKQVVLQRFQSMDATLSHPLENAGRGLAQALHYGIDRVPAVVFDGQIVIYGVTDVDEARTRYPQWRERSGR